MAKPSILFLISNMESGGVSKSMASLLNAIDRKRYHVAVLISSPTGVNMPLIPNDIELITDPRLQQLMGGFSGAGKLLLSGHPLLASGSIVRMALSRLSRSWSGRMLASLMPVPQAARRRWDLIVDYNGQHQLYFMMHKLNGRRKATFFHSDYSKWPYYFKADSEYLPKADAVFSISDHCVRVMKEWFPAAADKTHLFENISSPLLISQWAHEEPATSMPEDVINLVTVGHVQPAKGSHWAMEAARLLQDRGINFHWTFVGKVADPTIPEQAHRLGIDSRITFAGIQPNPYAYMARADIIVHPSQFEGKSIALDEAKILARPVVVTNFSTVHDQFTDSVDGIICEMTPRDIADKIEFLARNPEERARLTEYLASHQHDNSSEVEKLYRLIQP